MIINILPQINTYEEIHVLGSQTVSFDELPKLFKEFESDEEKMETFNYSFQELKYDESHYIKDTVGRVHCIVLDIDNDNSSKMVSTEKTHILLKKLNINHFIATTHTHSEEKHKFRIIIPLFVPINADIWDSFKQQFEQLKLWKLLSPDMHSLERGRRFILPPKGSITFFYNGGETFNPVNLLSKAVMSREKKRKKRIVKNGVSYHPDLFDDDTTKPFKYYQKIVENRSSDFHKGNRDNWINTTIFILQKNKCEPDDIHTLLDDYIKKMSPNEQNKFNKKIRR